MPKRRESISIGTVSDFLLPKLQIYSIIIKKKTGKKFFPNSDKNEDLIVIHMKGENLVCQTLISDPTRILKPFI